MFEKSEAAFTEAKRHFPGGVNSPVRAFKSVGGTPLFFQRGEGPYLYDLDGNRYIDFVLSWGPLVVGHAHPEVTRRLSETLHLGTSFGAPTLRETDLALAVKRLLPSIEVLRLVNSGTEATMSAIRLARAATGRTKLIKFVGNYHGHSDALLVKAGSGVATLGLPDSPGVPPSFAGETLTVAYNDIEAVAALFRQFPEQIAAVMVEPVAGNMGLILPRPGFLEGLRELTSSHGALLIFDEVMTGFRVSLAGAQGRFGITPDLTCLGKVIGGGLPVGAYGGAERLMRLIAPDGPVYQAGTLSGNPLAVTAGLATLEVLERAGSQAALADAETHMAQGMRTIAARFGLDMRYSHIGSMGGFFFSKEAVWDYEGAKRSNTAFYNKIFHEALRRGVYLAPSAFEAFFLCTAHTTEVLDDALNRLEDAFAAALLPA